MLCLLRVSKDSERGTPSDSHRSLLILSLGGWSRSASRQRGTGFTGTYVTQVLPSLSPRSVPVPICLSSPGHEARVLATEPQGRVTHHALPLGKGSKELDSCVTFPPTGQKRVTRLFQHNDPSPPREVTGTLLPRKEEHASLRPL